MAVRGVVLYAACLFMVNCSCSAKGAPAGIKDPGPLEEAIARFDLSTAKELLGIAESETEQETESKTESEAISGEHRLMCELVTSSFCMNAYSNKC